MHTFNASKIELSFKDNSKGQKISAGLYLVTAHLSDNDPMKNTIRQRAVRLLESDTLDHKRTLSIQIADLLSTAVLARLISEKNASILVLELRHFASLGESEGDEITEALKSHFGQPSLTSFKSVSLPAKKTSTNFSQRQEPITASKSTFDTEIKQQKVSNKNQRQEAILSFINNRKSAAIKDIAALFPEVSEKTIQRELTSLVSSGHITKRGEKRWSLYMAI